MSNQSVAIEIDVESAEHSEHYSDEGFWSKVGNVFRSAGEVVLEPALKLYYAAQDPETPAWAAGTVYGALGYFIFPLDLIPDLIPVVGYVDDLGVLTAAVATIATYITDEHVAEAKDTLKRWFD